MACAIVIALRWSAGAALAQQEQFASPTGRASYNSLFNDESDAPPAVPAVPDFLTHDDLAPLLSRINQLESDEKSKDDPGLAFMETPSIDSLRVFNGRLHVDEWGFPASSPGINEIENGDPRENPASRLLLRRVRLSVAGKVPPQNVSYHLDLEFSGTDRGQVRDAWLGIDDLAWFSTVRIGNQKRPYALDELNNSNFMVFLERPFVVSAFNEENRRFGIASYSNTADKRFNWRFGLFHLKEFQDTGSIVGNLEELEIVGRLASTSLYDERREGRDYLHSALAIAIGFPDDDPTNTTARLRTRPEARTTTRWLDTGPIGGAKAYEILAFETVLNLGPLQVGGEYMNQWLQRESVYGKDLFIHGGYVYVSHFLTDDFLPWNRDLGILGRLKPSTDFVRKDSRSTQGIGAWQVAARLSMGDFSDSNVQGGVGKSATVALNWYLNSHTRLQSNYIFGRIDDRALSSTPGSRVVSGDYQILGVRMLVDY
jgi:phosphate-selective porin OprO and OprP